MYSMARKLGLLDTHLGLILIYTSMNLSLVIWLLRFAPRSLMKAYILRDRFIMKTSTRF